MYGPTRSIDGPTTGPTSRVCWRMCGPMADRCPPSPTEKADRAERGGSEPSRRARTREVEHDGEAQRGLCPTSRRRVRDRGGRVSHQAAEGLAPLVFLSNCRHEADPVP